jgi:hypothetical protein
MKIAMKQKEIIKVAAFILLFTTLVFWLEGKRQSNLKISKKTTINRAEATNNTDFILFESVSKYLFVPLIK